MIKSWNLNSGFGFRVAFSLILMTLFFSCDNESSEFGTGLLPDSDIAAIQLHNSFTIKGYTVSPNSLYSRDVDTFMVGSIYNDEFGTVTANSIFKFQPLYSFYPQQDSIVGFGVPYLVLYPAGNVGVSYDKVLPNIHVYEITSEFDTLEYSLSDANIESLEKIWLNDTQSAFDSNSLIKINLPRAYASRYLEPYINYDSIEVTYNSDGVKIDTPFVKGIYFDLDELKNSINPILIDNPVPYNDFITKIVSLNSAIVFPVIYADKRTDFLRYFLTSVHDNFNANYFSYEAAEGSEFAESLNDTVNDYEHIYLQSQRAESKLVIEGLEELKASLNADEVIVYKAALKIPVSELDINETELKPARIGLKFYDNKIIQDDPQNFGSTINPNYLDRFDGHYYAEANAYRFDISLYVEDYLNGHTNKNKFSLFIPDNMFATYDNSSYLDTIIASRNKAEMVILNNGQNNEKPITLDVFYTTVEK